MKIVYVLFGIIFSLVLGVLYYSSRAAKNSFKTKVTQGFAKVLEILNSSSHQQNKSIKNTTLESNGIPERWQWVEWLVIIVSIWVYCLPFLDLGSSYNLPGPEAEPFQAFDQVLVSSIQNHGQFPLWNPYFFTGTPYVAHPMLHAYNPFISIPVLLFGVLDGFKIAVFLGFIIAGLGMWWMGKEIGLSRAGRIWIGLMYTFSGVPAAKFIQGHYLMVFGFGWIPFSLAAILAATRTKQRKYICMAAVGLALLFFSGNVYYAYYMLYVVAIYVATSVFKFDRNPIKLNINQQNIKVLAAIGALSLGLIAIQLLPLAEYRDQYFKPINTNLSDSRSIRDIFLDFTTPEPFRPGAFSYQLRPEEFYAYIGWWPLIGMSLLPLAWKKQNKRNIILFLSLVVFTFVWIDVKDMPWRSLFQTVPFLYQFRYPSRMVVVGAMALVAAGGLGLDGLLRKKVQNIRDSEPENKRHCLKKILWPLAIGIFMIWSIRDVALTSRPLLQTTNPYHEHREQTMGWLRNFDSGIYYVNAPLCWNQAIIRNEFRYQNICDPITVIPNFDNQISERKIVAGPKYQILPNDVTAPKDALLIKAFDTISIYRMTNDLPFAFTLNTSVLTTRINSKLAASEVTPETSFTSNINSIEGIIESDSNKALIVLSNFTSGWQLTIDGKPTKIYSAYGYMAAEVNPGTHHYLFVYKPVWFFVGLTISIATLLIIIVLLLADLSNYLNFGFRQK